MKVKEIMTKKPIVARLPASREDVVALLVKNKKTGLPVVKDSTGEYIGFLNRQMLFDRPETEQLALLVDRDYPTVSGSDDIKEAARILLDNELHHLPVVNRKGMVEGVVTPADFLPIIAEKGSKNPVEKYVRSPCVPLHLKTPLKVALLTMRLTKLYAFPVVNDEGILTGIITDRDIFNRNVIEKSISTADIGLGDDEDVWNWEGLKNVMKLYYEISKIDVPNIPVEEIMIRNPKTIFRQSPVSDAAEIMYENDYGQLPIRDENNRLMAMIYELDLLASLLED